LAGIPVTAGFIGKFYVLAAGASTAKWVLAITLVLTSGIGLYYYLRIIVALYSEPGRQLASPSRAGIAPAVVLAALMVLLIWFGVFPRGLLSMIRNAVAGVS
jgi:NADH-quinone oxidoreductase subunit N